MDSHNRRKEDTLKYKLTTVAGILGALITIAAVVKWFGSTTFITQAQATECHTNYEKRLMEIEKKNAVVESKLDNLDVTTKRIEATQLEILHEMRNSR